MSRPKKEEKVTETRNFNPGPEEAASNEASTGTQETITKQETGVVSETVEEKPLTETSRLSEVKTTERFGPLENTGEGVLNPSRTGGVAKSLEPEKGADVDNTTGE